MSDYVIRPMGPEHEDGVVYCWLKSYAHSRYGKSVGANADGSEGETRYWQAHRPVVMDLVRNGNVSLIVDPKVPTTFWAFLCAQGTKVHYLLAKRNFHRAGLAGEMFTALLGGRLKESQVYTHELVELTARDVGIEMPGAWTYDPSDWTGRVLCQHQASVSL